MSLEQRLANEKAMHVEVERQLKADVDRVLELLNAEREENARLRSELEASK